MCGPSPCQRFASALAVMPTVVAVFSLMAVTFVVLAASVPMVAFTVLMEARASAIASSEATATGQRHRTAGAQGEESSCNERRQT
jgi:hypothetical protein